jgi:hypothetical protein
LLFFFCSSLSFLSEERFMFSNYWMDENGGTTKSASATILTLDVCPKKGGESYVWFVFHRKWPKISYSTVAGLYFKWKLSLLGCDNAHPVHNFGWEELCFCIFNCITWTGFYLANILFVCMWPKRIRSDRVWMCVCVWVRENKYSMFPMRLKVDYIQNMFFFRFSFIIFFFVKFSARDNKFDNTILVPSVFF